MKTVLKYISYISRQAHILNDANLESLLTNCRKKNTERNITGLLISYKGHFIQYIEGEPDKIDKLFGKIKKDPRHYEVVELASDHITQRQFSNWSMAFRKVDEDQAEDLLGYRRLQRDEVFNQTGDKMNSPAMQLLNSFVNNL
ncbi:BLUF domain-containing protein [Christiangramia sabulilitoris]|uniref:BLUF domain-containing protein n=1 Tax=Christiangramia sabulilitoris TaxID=2583991 RepID=UPI0014087210|nr:BLUF domain-containing protein [Christiangramia sabulilitoris]